MPSKVDGIGRNLGSGAGGCAERQVINNGGAATALVFGLYLLSGGTEEFWGEAKPDRMHFRVSKQRVSVIGI